MKTELDKYLEVIKADYGVWAGPTEDAPIRKRMLDEFCATVTTKIGTKYIKIMAGCSVHSFIVLNDGPKFKKGDILKAMSYAAPAKNFARGNILTGDYSGIRWTGA